MRKNKTKAIYYIAPVLAIILFALVFSSFDYQQTLERRTSPGENVPIEIVRTTPFHAHADFKVVLNGKEFSFNKTQFDVANKYIHLHLRNPDGDKVIHIEGMENITLTIFFDSLNITFNASCFVTDVGESYCINSEKRIRFFVNGKENFQFDFYEPRNLDRMLITYGDFTEEEIKKQVENVTDYACIYSNRCPERVAELPVPETELTF